jgi:hypothetical protein
MSSKEVVLQGKFSKHLLTEIIYIADYCEVYPVYSRLLGAVEDGGPLEDNSSEVTSYMYLLSGNAFYK